MNIGTAKPTAGEMDGIRHHLIDVLEPWESFSADKFVRLAKEDEQFVYDHIKPAYDEDCIFMYQIL